MSRQLRLHLRRPPDFARDAFIVSRTNDEAVRALEAWPNWHGGVLALVGPAGSGKSHLAEVWRARADAVVLGADSRLTALQGLHGRPVLMENADQSEPETLFHLINMAAEPGGGLLVTARSAPSSWASPLPDLRSRLNALPVAELGAPDDEILEGVLQKFFRERNIRPADDVLPYLVHRMERSVPDALALVEKLDEASDARGRPVSRALARQILEEDAEGGDLFPDPLADPISSGHKDV